ncbi:MAG: NnrS family protein, partial [Myxococcota bacterium]|nr:NnrS family protein [Myxococcota bacterium]
GLLLRAAGNLLALHALTVGALGALTLGMMARVSLGHTGRPLAVPKSMSVGFLAITVAALVRVLGPWLLPGHYLQCLWMAGALWTLSFALFVWVYAPILTRPRVDGKAG